MAVEIKICGLSTEATLDAALDAGADHVGFVAFSRSPRHVTVERAAALAARARGRAGVVLLTVDMDDAELDALTAAVKPDTLQLHGRETPERAAELKRRHGLAVWKAVPVSDAEDLDAVGLYEGVVDRVLFDARPPRGAALPGGNGVAFDWRLLDRLDPKLRFVLSGGLAPENVAEALSVVHAPAVDVSSGVESAPGVKDPERIRAFVAAVRGA
ncbi:N-(5'-phosphoribosyl)anthranilate isomerase [Methylopila jiangsuensis]|uniref:N-(5'-phosphoribosyl)anthranilate isomerase n=1 Tax=Methylopila jiangsuensis TaxID=586230 RepID=A0A9W6JHV2_9HYPH|nr:phosphoribosylanthranilate isomerase [Methylopila jiangsuensis]MDR6286291.1 phosphoribosylanthranilate isomerase [Methylopila jiangsuensis]GLK76054.1 N-(5'-phosphoribosyl)anthranilate isomerase [Methylopila jiangsuensis]